MRASAVGGGVVVVFTGNGIAANNDYVWWANHDGRQVRRARIGGAGGVTSLAPTYGWPVESSVTAIRPLELDVLGRGSS